MEQYKRKFEEAHSEEDTMKPFKDKAVKELTHVYDQAKAGYGTGNALGHIIDVLKKSLPSNIIGFLQDKHNWSK